MYDDLSPSLFRWIVRWRGIAMTLKTAGDSWTGRERVRPARRERTRTTREDFKNRREKFQNN